MKTLTFPRLALICIVFATTTQAQVAPEQARNFQINDTHTGSISTEHLTPPLRQRCVVNFGRSISYPLIADGRVYVTVPATGAVISGNAEWNTSLVSVTLHASDNLSGVASTFYRIDGGAAQTYASTFSLTAGGVHSVEFWSVDVAGNAEAHRTRTV